MNATSLRLVRALAALTLCVAPAALVTPAAADPPVGLCTPVGAACVAADADVARCDASGVCTHTTGSASACTPDGAGCANAAARACPPNECTAAIAEVAVCGPAGTIGCHVRRLEPLGGIEQPATGTITINESSGVVTTVLTGVFDPSTGNFTCTTTAPANAERTVRCVPNSPGIDWYCAGWILTATTHTYNSQVAGQTSCADYQGFPGGSSYQTLWTDFACCNQTESATAASLSWFVSGAIVCQAWGYSAGPKPMGDYTVTCNEPGANP